ncbi:MAG: ATP-binding protein [Limisphaerales bacterium]
MSAPEVPPAAALRLERALERGRLGHGWLFTGPEEAALAATARHLAALLVCAQPPRRAANGLPLAACGSCAACRRVALDEHPDVAWVRPESKTRVVRVEQVRELIRLMQLKPAEAPHKLGIVAAAHRMNEEGANTFLKTLEEPPPRTVLVLLSTEPDRLLETIRSRCQRLALSDTGGNAAAGAAWLAGFALAAAGTGSSLLDRYRLLDVLLAHLKATRETVAAELGAQSALERYDDLDPNLREHFEGELAAAIEGEFRRRRGDALAALEWWLRDIWLLCLAQAEGLLSLPALAPHSRVVARRLQPADADANLASMAEARRLLHTNVQEALVLEVALLKLKL